MNIRDKIELLRTIGIRSALAAFGLIIVFTSNHLFDVLELSKNVNGYDHFVQVFGFLSISYSIVPIFLMVLLVYFSKMQIRPYISLRYGSTTAWVSSEMMLIGLLSVATVLAFVCICFLQSLLTLGFKGGWSEHAKNYYEYFEVFLNLHHPVQYIIVTVICTAFLLFVLGLIFFICFLKLRNIIASLVIVVLCWMFNNLVTIGKIGVLSPWLFTDHVDLFTYMYRHKISQSSFPYQIIIYWLVLTGVLIAICIRIAKTEDLIFGKENVHG